MCPPTIRAYPPRARHLRLAWLAKTPRTHQFLREQLRVIGQDARLLYGKRYYKDGRIRPIKLAVTDAVQGHIARVR